MFYILINQKFYLDELYNIEPSNTKDNAGKVKIFAMKDRK